MTGSDQPTEILHLPAAGSEDVGSARLRAALAARDISAIGRALRHDVVILPLLHDDATGQTQVQVIGFPAEGSTPAGVELCLFSSSAAYARFIGDSPDRSFALRRGSDLAPFLAQHHAVLARVAFDPAEPHAMTASPEDVLAILEPQPDDDDVAWLTEGDEGNPDAPLTGRVPERTLADGLEGMAVVGLEVPLPGEWVTLDLAKPRKLAKQISKLVDRQLKGLAPAPVLRDELTRWLTTVCERAAQARARTMAFLVQRSDDDALALTMTMYWHDLGPAVGEPSHLEPLARRLAGLDDGGTVLRADTAAGPLVRHERVLHGGEELGIAKQPVLVLDYWLERPDGNGLALVSFSTPHVALTEHVRTLTDALILEGGWVLEPER
ncbi:MAG: hypothetical protein GX593_05680 [Actinomycetales bacterium]|nr:hypothetical protein [Actinomycetales bacterium]